MSPAPPRSTGQSRHPSKRQPAISANGSPEAVDPIWLLKAAGVVLLAALLCGYLTLCLLFYQGQWQLVLHPDHSTAAPASINGAPLETVYFAVDESGKPQLTGWWIPSEPNGRYSQQTLLYLPGGDGSLAHDVDRLVALHSLGINLFAFDYRGYGQSAPTHPNQQRMTQDTASAWHYLTVSRHIPGTSIIPFGEGLGAALAANLAAEQQQVPGVILDSPRTDVLKTVLADSRSQLLPAQLLFHESFDITAQVANLRTPKLFLLPEGADSLQAARSAGDPKTIVALPPAQLNGPAYLEQLHRFLDQLHPVG